MEEKVKKSKQEPEQADHRIRRNVGGEGGNSDKSLISVERWTP